MCVMRQIWKLDNKYTQIYKTFECSAPPLYLPWIKGNLHLLFEEDLLILPLLPRSPPPPCPAPLQGYPGPPDLGPPASLHQTQGVEPVSDIIKGTVRNSKRPFI